MYEGHTTLNLCCHSTTDQFVFAVFFRRVSVIVVDVLYCYQQSTGAVKLMWIFDLFPNEDDDVKSRTEFDVFIYEKFQFLLQLSAP